jgi:asparagine synthase (glutamine-hydrolysing)
VSGEVDDIWMLNFLAKQRRADFERTAYRDIKRLPPGHVLDAIRTGADIRKYWQLEIEKPIYYKRYEEYLEHFRDLAKTTIRDRIRIGMVGVAMSGDLDSTSIVAFLLQLVENRTRDIAVISNYLEGMDDDERRYAAAAADHFGIPIDFLNVDSMMFDPQWWTRSWLPPEPSESVLWRFLVVNPPKPDPFGKIRVVLSGDGPDDALQYKDWKSYLRWLLETGRIVEFGSAVRSRLSARPFGEIFSSLKGAFRSHNMVPKEKLPWLRSDVLEDRKPSGDLQSKALKLSRNRHPWHPSAVAHFRSPIWQDFFECFDPGFGGRLLETAHPYLDLRMVQFLLSVPVVPWCHKKLLIRESMRGFLPELVLARNKTPLAGDPWVKAMVEHPFPQILNTPELSRYVDMSRIPTRWAADVQQNRMIRKLIVLQHWLAARNRHSISNISEVRDATKLSM